MGLFKKKEDDKDGANEKGSFVKVLGTGCAKCIGLENNVKKAMAELGMAPEVEHVKDINRIVSYGVMMTPALVLGKEVVSVGKVLSVAEAAELLKKYKE
ncbi:MAG: thioredoxin family protein [Methanomassiliicoccales archaeon]|nr:thioredoxin family protein [Methanomassiliicoccales archaeon]